MSSVDDFMAWSEHDRGRSPHTLSRYKAVLAQIDHPETATVEQIEQWWATRYHLSEATRANELACLRSYYKWALRFDVRDTDPTRRLEPPKVPNKVPRPIGQTDLDRLLGPLSEDAPDMRRAIALGAYGGLRVSEAAALEWADVDLESRRIYVRGKGSKQRVIGIHPVLLDKLLPQVRGNVVTAGESPYSGATLQRRVNRFIARADMDNTFHDLRKRGASLAMGKVRNPQAVAQVFGWSSLQTVTHYAVVSDETLDEIAAAMI